MDVRRAPQGMRLRGDVALLVAWLLLGAGDGLHGGTYSGVALGLVSTGCAFLSLPFLLPGRFPLERPSDRALSAALLLVGLTYPLTNVLQAGQDPVKSQARAALAGVALLAAGLLLSRGVVRRALVPIVLGIATWAGLASIHANPRPPVDVWFLVQGAAQSVLHASNMYTETWTGSPGITDTFPYLPGTGVLLAPWRLIGLDVRHGLLALTLLAALVVWRLAPDRAGTGLLVLVLLVPSWLVQVEVAWTEPLLLASLVLLLLAVQRGRLGWAVIALAAAVFTKQHVLLVLPLLAVWPALGPRRVAIAVVSASMATLPWFLAAPHDFLRGALYLNLDLPPRSDSLSAFTFLRAHGAEPRLWMVSAVTLAALVTATGLVRRRQTPAGAALGCAWVLAVFHLVNKQSFYNEWWLVITLIPIALALAPTSPDRPPAVA